MIGQLGCIFSFFRHCCYSSGFLLILNFIRDKSTLIDPILLNWRPFSCAHLILAGKKLERIQLFDRLRFFFLGHFLSGILSLIGYVQNLARSHCFSAAAAKNLG